MALGRFDEEGTEGGTAGTREGPGLGALAVSELSSCSSSDDRISDGAVTVEATLSHIDVDRMFSVLSV